MVIGHGNDKYKYEAGIKHDFSSNIPGGIDHSGLVEYLKDRLLSIKDYPNPTGSPLDELLSKRLDIPAECICITNGATESIYLTAQSFHGSRSAILMPTFSEYADACRMNGHTVKSIFSLDAIPADAQFIWLCNPNNPTGSVLSREVLLDCIEKHQDSIFVIDQSYESLTAEPLLRTNEAVLYPNVILIHSLTKEFAIPGLRLGYLTAPLSLIRQITAHRMPWSVNQLAIQAGYYLLQHEDEYELDLEGLLDECDYVGRRLTEMGGMEVWPSKTNFLLVQLRNGKASALKDYLAREHQILIRDCSNFEGLDERFFRIAVQSPEENELLLSAIEEWILA